MTPPWFADSFFWIALTDLNDASHMQVLDLISKGPARVTVTTDEVLAEYLTFFSNAPERLRREAADTVRDILRNPAIRVIPQSHESFLSGLDLYGRRPDKHYSLTDCISMQAMRREDITEALTNDRHFEQEGFRALADVSHLMNGHFSRFTTEKLLEFLRRLDRKVTLEVSRHPKGEPHKQVTFTP